MSVLKRQHFVWRHYLRSWADNDKIWTYLKESDKIIQPDLMGVAQEKYFYRLVDFSEDEVAFLEKYIILTSPRLVKDLNLDFLRLFTSTSKLKRTLDATTNPAVDKDKYAEEIRKLEIDLMEIGHGKMEALGHKILSYRSFEDLKTIEQDDYIFEAIMFVCFQYCRTKNMRKSVLEHFIGGPFEELANKSWNILSYVTATTLAKNISLDPKIKFVFIENCTTNHFITSDQPVFNILNDKLNEQGEVAELEFYYPITPNHAISFHFKDDQNDKFISQVADDALIFYLNNKVLENSDYFVFADTKEQLERLK